MPPKIDDTIPDIVTGPGAGQILGVSRERVWTMREEGRLPCRVVTAPPSANPDDAQLFVVFRRVLMEQYAANGLPAPTGERVTDVEIPEIVNSAWAAERLGVDPQTVNQLYRLGKLRGKPAMGGTKQVGGESRQTTSLIVFQPEEIDWALGARTKVTEYRWAPAR